MNEDNDQFEKQLKRQSLQQIPSAWREEILSAASQAQPVRRSVSDHAFLSVLNQRLSSLLWPHPVAWGGLAVVWIFIFCLNFSSRDQAPVLADKASPASPEVVAELHQQQRLYVELMDLKDSGDADRQKVFVPRPRSERVETLTA